MNKVFVYSKNKFREILSEIEGAVISIEGTPGCIEAYLVPVKDDNDNDHLLPGGPTVFNVRFDDVTKDGEYKGKEIKAITEEQADAMVGFIEDNIGKDFYIHCKAGKSRSQGVATFIIDMYEDNYEMGNLDPMMMTPNREVVRKLKRAYYKKHKLFEFAEVPKQVNEFDKNRPHIVEEAQRDAGKYVTFFGGEVLRLLGAIDLVDDYYWVSLGDDGKLRLHSCVGGYDVVEDTSRFFMKDWNVDYNKLEEEIEERLIGYARNNIEDFNKRHKAEIYKVGNKEELLRYILFLRVGE